MTFDPLQNHIGSEAIERLIEKSAQPGQEAGEQQPRPSFDDLLGRLVHDVDTLQKTAESTLHELAGDLASEPDGMAQKMKEADDAYNLMMQIRHKLVDVYSAVESQEQSGSES